MTTPPLLLDSLLLSASVADWIVPVIVVAFFIISHLWNAVKSVQQQAPQRRTLEKPAKPQPGDQRGAANPPPQQAGAGQGQLNAEIEEFLKRANQRRGEKRNDLGKRQTSASGRQQPARQTPPKAPLPSEKAARQPRSADTPRRGFDNVAESVQQHLGERKFEQRESRLADDVVRAEQQLAQHVDQAFGNRLGTLATADPAPAQPAEVVTAVVTDDSNSMARALAGLLVNQQNLRQAILLKEILDRPVDRW
jgi:hypothetical protein